jgi:multidrug resistance efflux pump
MLVLVEKERVDRQKAAVLARRRQRLLQQSVPPSPEVREAAARESETRAARSGTPDRCVWRGAQPAGRSGRCDAVPGLECPAEVMRPLGRM